MAPAAPQASALTEAAAQAVATIAPPIPDAFVSFSSHLSLLDIVARVVFRIYQIQDHPPRATQGLHPAGSRPNVPQVTTPSHPRLRLQRGLPIRRNHKPPNPRPRQ